MGDSDQLDKPEALLGVRLGSCVLDRVLSVGGMGTVYLAHQKRPRRTVAVKVLRTHLASDPHARRQFLARFQREANASAALDHANVLPVYEFGEDHEIAYLVMPYLAPGSLADLLARRGPLPLDQTLAYLDQAAAALDYAHQHGIVHRDVKPSNFLLHGDGRLLLADFGIARPVPVPAASDDDTPTLSPSAEQRAPLAQDAPLTQMGASVGTPEFMAPEQVRSEPVSAATDVYALGAVAYALLAGHPPFAGDDVGGILVRQVREAPPPLRALRPDVPPNVERAIAWALAKAPSERPPSAGAFVQALHTAGARSLPSFTGGAGTAEARLPHTWASATAQGTQPSTGSDDQTLADVSAERLGVMPAWPVARLVAGDSTGQQRSGRRRWLLGAGAAALVLALLLGGLSQAARFVSLDAIANQPTATPTAVPSPTAQPTPTATATATSSALSIGLEVAPSSITLSCDGPPESGVVLQNTGSQDVEWAASVQPSHSGVRVVPDRGRLAAGASLSLSITSTFRRPIQQGTILFRSEAAATGTTPSLTFTTLGCG
jgi:serine/threonine protein kinase